jgi:hypothetical protein
MKSLLPVELRTSGGDLTDESRKRLVSPPLKMITRGPRSRRPKQSQLKIKMNKKFKREPKCDINFRYMKKLTLNMLENVH